MDLAQKTDEYTVYMQEEPEARRPMSTLCTHIEELDARRPMSKLHVYMQEALEKGIKETNEYTVYMQEELEASRPTSTLCTCKKRLKQGDR